MACAKGEATRSAMSGLVLRGSLLCIVLGSFFITRFVNNSFHSVVILNSAVRSQYSSGMKQISSWCVNDVY